MPETAKAGLVSVVRWTPTDDDEITCLVCGLPKCDIESVIHGPGRLSVVGAHTHCAEKAWSTMDPLSLVLEKLKEIEARMPVDVTRLAAEQRLADCNRVRHVLSGIFGVSATALKAMDVWQAVSNESGHEWRSLPDSDADLADMIRPWVHLAR